MLNRRLLRAKVLQALYSLEVAREANLGLAQDYIQEIFTPDWIEKTHTTPAQVAQEIEQAHKHFKIGLANSEAVDKAMLEPKIRKAAQDAIFHYKNLCHQDETRALQSLKNDIQTIQTLYLKALLLPQEITQLVKEDQERYQQKIKREGISEERGDFKLARNPLYEKLIANPSVEDQIIRYNPSWEAQRGQLRKAYRTFFEQDEKYQKYDTQVETSAEEDQEMMLYLIRQVAFRQAVMNEYEVSEIKIHPPSWQEIFSKYSFDEFWVVILEKTLPVLQDFFDDMDIKSSEEYLRKIRQDIQKKTQLFANRLKAELRDQTVSETLRKYRNIRPESETPNPSSFFNENHFLIEQVTQQWLKDTVNVLSQVLGEHSLNHNDTQKTILQAFDKVLFSFMDNIGIASFSSNQITVQILAEKTGSVLSEYFYEEDINWEENQKTIQNLTLKTFKNAYEGQEDVLMDLSSNWESDYEFYLDLFKQTIIHEDMVLKQIASKSKNWDVSRLPVTDKIILKMAVAEMIYFYSIPVKVSINEYVDLAKQISTPKSKQFINGIVETISKELLENKIIKKSGRGLITNS
jgi:transcription antitermination factor NusB